MKQFKQIVRLTQNFLDQMGARQLSTLLWACAVAGYRDLRLIDDIMEQGSKVLSEFKVSCEAPHLPTLTVI